jgi:hypothetical protein
VAWACALGSYGTREGFLALRRARYAPVDRQMGSLVLHAYRTAVTPSVGECYTS